MPKPSTAARRDANERSIIEAFEVLGATVSQECPLDLIVAWPGRTILVEVKDGSKVPSQQKLTEAEARFIAGWKGECYVVRSELQAEAAVYGIRLDKQETHLSTYFGLRAEIQHIRATPIEQLRREGLVK